MQTSCSEQIVAIQKVMREKHGQDIYIPLNDAASTIATVRAAGVDNVAKMAIDSHQQKKKYYTRMWLMFFAGLLTGIALCVAF